jgi:hypothetical protein
MKLHSNLYKITCPSKKLEAKKQNNKHTPLKTDSIQILNTRLLIGLEQSVYIEFINEDLNYQDNIMS